MPRISAVLLLALALTKPPGVVGQEPRPSTPPAAIRLPPGFVSLGLSDTQKAQVAAIQARHRGEIKAAQSVVDRLHQAQRAELESVLTAPQKAKLADARKERSEARKATKKRGAK